MSKNHVRSVTSEANVDRKKANHAVLNQNTGRRRSGLARADEEEPVVALGDAEFVNTHVRRISRVSIPARWPVDVSGGER